MSDEKMYLPIFISFIPCLLIFPSFAFSGALEGVRLSISTLIPSLFAFMVISEGLITLLQQKKIPFCIFSRILRVNPLAEPIILLSFIGGYPIGARCIGIMYNNGVISKGEAKRLCLCLVNPSPCFVISAVGLNMMGSITAGVILFISVYLANAVTSLGLVLFRNTGDFNDKTLKKTVPIKNIPYSNGFIFVNSVMSSSITMLYICMFTVFFGTVTGVLDAVFDNSYLKIITNCICEVSLGVSQIINNGFLSLPILAATLSFGGLCVMLQVIMFSKEMKIKPLYYILTRMTSSAIAFITAKFLSVFYAPDKAVFSNTVQTLSPTDDYGFLSSILVMLAATVFVLSINKSNSPSRYLHK